MLALFWFANQAVRSNDIVFPSHIPQIDSLDIVSHDRYMMIVAPQGAPTNVCQRIAEFHPTLKRLQVESLGHLDTRQALNTMLAKLSNLQSLELSHVPPMAFPVLESIQNLGRLTKLVLSRSTGPPIPEWLFELQGIRCLELSNFAAHAGQWELPSAITNMRVLETLILVNSRIISLPDNFGDLGGSLLELDLSANPQLRVLPASMVAFSRLTSLRVLGMGHIVAAEGVDGEAATVGSIAWITGHLVGLKKLDMSRCGLNKVCVAFCCRFSFALVVHSLYHMLFDAGFCSCDSEPCLNLASTFGPSR